MRLTNGMLAAMLAVASAGPVVAQPTCVPPLELAGWAQRRPLVAVTRLGGDPAPELVPGEAVDLALAPIDTLILATPLGKSPQAGDQGGMVRFRVALSGTYRIALGHHAWIDILQGGKPVASTAHGSGPECAGVAKRVDFALAPGTYVLQLSASTDVSMPLMIARLP